MFLCYDCDYGLFASQFGDVTKTAFSAFLQTVRANIDSETDEDSLMITRERSLSPPIGNESMNLSTLSEGDTVCLTSQLSPTTTTSMRYSSPPRSPSVGRVTSPSPQRSSPRMPSLSLPLGAAPRSPGARQSSVRPQVQPDAASDINTELETDEHTNKSTKKENSDAWNEEGTSKNKEAANTLPDAAAPKNSTAEKVDVAMPHPVESNENDDVPRRALHVATEPTWKVSRDAAGMLGHVCGGMWDWDLFLWVQCSTLMYHLPPFIIFS